MQNLVGVGQRKESLRRDGIFRYFLCFIYLLILYKKKLQAIHLML